MEWWFWYLFGLCVGVAIGLFYGSQDDDDEDE